MRAGPVRIPCLALPEGGARTVHAQPQQNKSTKTEVKKPTKHKETKTSPSSIAEFLAGEGADKMVAEIDKDAYANPHWVAAITKERARLESFKTWRHATSVSTA